MAQTKTEEFMRFAGRVEKDIRTALGADFPGLDIQREEISKLQGKSYTALTVTPAGGQIGMNINLDRFYGRILDGESYDSVLDSTVTQITQAIARPDNGWMMGMDVSKITDYGKAKPLLCVEVVGTERNAKMLENIPHTDIEDLSIVYRLQLGKDEQGVMTVLVTNDMLEQYGVTKEQLHADALESSRRNRPAFIKTIQETLAEMLDMPEYMMEDVVGDMGPDGVPPLYVVSNEDRCQGAAAAFYPGIMDVAAKKLNGDYFILPSSIHEVLLLPDDGRFTGEEAANLVSQVNGSEVLPEDLLSYSIYHYCAATHTFGRI